MVSKWRFERVDSCPNYAGWAELQRQHILMERLHVTSNVWGICERWKQLSMMSKGPQEWPISTRPTVTRWSSDGFDTVRCHMGKNETNNNNKIMPITSDLFLAVRWPQRDYIRKPWRLVSWQERKTPPVFPFRFHRPILKFVPSKIVGVFPQEKPAVAWSR